MKHIITLLLLVFACNYAYGQSDTVYTVAKVLQRGNVKLSEICVERGHIWMSGSGTFKFVLITPRKYTVIDYPDSTALIEWDQQHVSVVECKRCKAAEERTTTHGFVGTEWRRK